MALTKNLGAVLSLSGTSILNTYTASDALSLGRALRVRFWAKVTTVSGSGLTSVTIKLQQRYNDGTITTAYLDLPSHLEDVAGAAQPKGNTYEIEHAFTLSAAPNTNAYAFTLKEPLALMDVTVNAKANTTGHVNDSVTIYAELA